MSDIFDILKKLAFKVAPYVPFTTSYIIRRCLGKQGETILDIGCGTGGPMRSMRRSKDSFSVGADIFLPYLRECKALMIYDDLVLCDVRMLPFRSKSFDIVVCLAVIEHLEKEHASELIRAMEEIARKYVVINTPVEFRKHGITEDNPYQIHKSGFSPIELKRAGYKVRGQQIPLNTDVGLLHWGSKRLAYSVMFALVNPLVYFLPRFAGTMTCIKKLGNKRE